MMPFGPGLGVFQLAVIVCGLLRAKDIAYREKHNTLAQRVESNKNNAHAEGGTVEEMCTTNFRRRLN